MVYVGVLKDAYTLEDESNCGLATRINYDQMLGFIGSPINIKLSFHHLFLIHPVSGCLKWYWVVV